MGKSKWTKGSAEFEIDNQGNQDDSDKIIDIPGKEKRSEKVDKAKYSKSKKQQLTGWEWAKKVLETSEEIEFNMPIFTNNPKESRPPSLIRGIKISSTVYDNLLKLLDNNRDMFKHLSEVIRAHIYLANPLLMNANLTSTKFKKHHKMMEKMHEITAFYHENDLILRNFSEILGAKNAGFVSDKKFKEFEQELLSELSPENRKKIKQRINKLKKGQPLGTLRFTHDRGGSQDTPD